MCMTLYELPDMHGKSDTLSKSSVVVASCKATKNGLGMHLND